LAIATRLGAGTGTAASSPNPFALNLERVSKTDPALVRYDEVRRFVCPDAGFRRLCLGPDEQIYAANTSGITLLDRKGTVVRRFATSKPAQCVSVDREGSVFVGLRDQVLVFNSQGSRTASWDNLDSRAWLTGMAVAEGRVFVADSGNRVILAYDLDGKLLRRIAKKDAERSIPGLSVPSPYLDVKVGKDCLLRVNNFGRHRVEAYTLEGDLEQSWGKPGAGIAGFCGCCNPVSIALLPNGDYATCEKGLARVKTYSGAGEFVSVVAGVEAFPEHARVKDATAGKLDVGVDSAGIIYVLDPVTSTIRVYKEKAA
jgi:hypothetical protein